MYDPNNFKQLLAYTKLVTMAYRVSGFIAGKKFNDQLSNQLFKKDLLTAWWSGDTSSCIQGYPKDTQTNS